MTTTCDDCGYVLPEPAPQARCPLCNGATHTDGAIVAGPGALSFAKAMAATFRVVNRFAPGWYKDARHEAQAPLGDIHARRREVVFAVSCAESYIYEWTRDLLQTTPGHYSRIDAYFPPKPVKGWNRSVTDQWKEVPKELHAVNILANKLDLSGAHGDDWLRLVDYRNGLIHALASRPQEYGPGPPIRPLVTADDLHAMAPGWATSVVEERVLRLHQAEGTAPPPWLTSPQWKPASD